LRADPPSPPGPAGNGALLALEAVSWDAPDGRQVLKEASLALAPGELAWLSGPSGGGKSSLLRLMNRLAEPSGGRITFRGKPLEQWDPPVLRRRVALLPQSPVVLPGSVGHNLRLPFSFKAGRERPLPSEDRLERLLAGLGLEGLGLGQPVTGLSLGQKQRLALARMLLLEPEVLLLDEPVSALDPESRALVEQTAVAQAGQGRAVLLVSHHPPENAGPARRLVLSGGRLEELS
jgi:putative ABC transport system ATP-binding protein